MPQLEREAFTERSDTVEKTYTAKNGIELYGYKNPALHGFFISLFVRGGSMYEGEENNGITHFLEHILIRNVSKKRGGRLYSELDRNGIEFNASTFSEMVQFYISGASESFSLGAKMISDLLSPIILSKEEIDTERRRIKAEIRENDEKSSLSSFSNEIVHAGTTLSRSITGSCKSVDKMTAKRLEEYRRTLFTKENVFLYISGNYTEEDMSRLAEFIGNYELSSGEVHENIAPVPKSFGKREREIHVKNADFTMLRFTFDIDMKKVSMTVCDLIYDILLSGYNSHFFVEMSEKRGLFYDISGSLERYRNIGTLHFSYELREKDLECAAKITADILKNMKNAPLPENELMKSGYVKNSGMLYDDAREFNFTMAYDSHIMNAGYASREERTRAYGKITPEDIRKACCEIFRADNLTVTVKGNKKKINKERLAEIVFSGLS